MRRLKKSHLLLASALSVPIAFGSVPLPVFAQQSPAGVVRQVTVEGAERVDPATVLSYLTIKPGDSVTPDAIDSSLKALFATGLFADVVIERRGPDLVVRVRENPIINRIAFEGNRRISDENLAAEIDLRERVVYTPTRVQSATQRIIEVYRRSGRFGATVEPKIIELDQNRVDLVFEVQEGSVTGIDAINFVGNEAFSDGDLRSVIRTTESAWWKIFATDDVYDPDRLAVDQELLRRFYLSNGYPDFRVVSAVAELSPTGEGFVVTITVEEGERYRFGPIDVVTSIPGLDVEQVLDVVTTEEGDWYSSDEVEFTIAELTTRVNELQFPFVDVQPIVSRSRDQRLIAITYDIAEGPRLFVERIDVVGNVRTQDQVVRREFELIEGDPFNATLLRRSETQIRNLGYFSQVNLNTIPGSAPDQVVVQAEVQEQSTGEFTIGAGYSTSDGPLGDIQIRERNLLGRGQDLRLGFTISGVSSQIDLSFTEPYFLDRPIAAGFDVFRVTDDNSDFADYEQSETGFALRMGYRLGENLRQTLRYRLADRTIENVDEDASRFIRDQEGSTLSSTILQSLVYDRLDSRIEPTDGYRLALTNEVAGLGGDVHWFSTVVSGTIYFPITDSINLNIRGEAGNIFGLGEDVGIADRFFISSGDLRGFSRGGIGPVVFEDGDREALGANNYAVASAELTFGLGLPEELGVKGRTFTDLGTAWDVDESGDEILGNDPTLRLSVGVGLTWASPFGPVRIDYAIPVVKEDFDDEERFRFSFGTTF